MLPRGCPPCLPPQTWYSLARHPRQTKHAPQWGRVGWLWGKLLAVVGEELLAVLAGAQFPQCRPLDLADAFAADAELVADLRQCVLARLRQPEAQIDHQPLARCKRL